MLQRQPRDTFVDRGQSIFRVNTTTDHLPGHFIFVNVQLCLPLGPKFLI